MQNFHALHPSPEAAREKSHALAALLSTPPPEVSSAQALQIGRAWYGFDTLVTSLSGERDRNFLMTWPGLGRAVLKFVNVAESADETECQIAVLQHVGRQNGPVLTPKPIPTVTGKDVATVDLGGGASLVRAYTFLEGRPATQVENSRGLRHSLGRALGQFDLALASFDHRGTERAILWDLMHLNQLAPFTRFVQDTALRSLVEQFMAAFEQSICPAVASLRQQVIHNDLSKSNFIVAQHADTEIAGIIDFGDMVHAPLVCDLAIAASYQMLDTLDPFVALHEVTEGFEEARPSQSCEREHLLDLVLARTVQRLVITEWRAAQFPENRAYILRHTAEARTLLTRLFPAWQRQSRHATFSSLPSPSKGVAP